MKLTPSDRGASSGSLLEKELRQQGAVLAARAREGRRAAVAAAEVLARDDVQYLVVAARGSSDNAAIYAQYALGGATGLTVALATPWLYRDPESCPDLTGAAVLTISQSGQSPDIIAVAAAARRQGRPSIAITNYPASPLGAEADVIVPLAVGDEQSVAATKTYMASLQAIQQIIAELQPASDHGAWLARMPELVTTLVDEQLEYNAGFAVLEQASILTTVGRGTDLAAAKEIALKIRELGALPAEGFSPPDLLHGPIASFAAPGCLWIVAAAAIAESWAPIVERAQAKAMPVVAVGADGTLAATADLVVPLPLDAPPWLRSILAVVPGQVAALRLAERRGVDIDHPHGLNKVTITH